MTQVKGGKMYFQNICTKGNVSCAPSNAVDESMNNTNSRRLGCSAVSSVKAANGRPMRALTFGSGPALCT